MTPVVAFFNNKGGVGKTSLVYHLATMYADLGTRVLAADLDPQANLTAAFIDEAALEKYWLKPAGGTVFDAIRPLAEGTGAIEDPHVASIEQNLNLLVGTLRLADLETDLAEQWPNCADGKPRAFRVMAAFWTVMQRAAELCDAEVVLLDLGPSLGAINRSALIAADHVVVPLAADLFSLTGLTNLGPRLRTWRREWQERLTKNPEPMLPLPAGTMRPAGYVIMQHAERDRGRPARAYEHWMNRIPAVFASDVLGLPDSSSVPTTPKSDPHCLALLRHYRSLAPLAQAAGKPVFRLRPADGALGSHVKAVQEAYLDFEKLAARIADVTWRPAAVPHKEPDDAHP